MHWQPQPQTHTQQNRTSSVYFWIRLFVCWYRRIRRGTTTARQPGASNSSSSNRLKFDSRRHRHRISLSVHIVRNENGTAKPNSWNWNFRFFFFNLILCQRISRTDQQSKMISSRKLNSRWLIICVLITLAAMTIAKPEQPSIDDSHVSTEHTELSMNRQLMNGRNGDCCCWLECRVQTNRDFMVRTENYFGQMLNSCMGRWIVANTKHFYSFNEWDTTYFAHLYLSATADASRWYLPMAKRNWRRTASPKEERDSRI